jgi:hypothetical protein
MGIELSAVVFEWRQADVHFTCARAPRAAGAPGSLGGGPWENAMEIVRITNPEELAPEDQRTCEATKAWFKIDFVPKMSRVLLTVPEFGRPYGRASRRAMADGALTRAQKELIATMVSAINVCEY